MSSGRALRRPLPLLCALLALALVAPADASAAKFGSRTLKFGMRGSDVRVLQKYLTRLTLPTSQTGYFYKVTRANVKRLEKRRSWRVNGVVSRKEARKIRRSVRRLPTPTAGTRSRYFFFGKLAPTVTLTGDRVGEARVHVLDANGATTMILTATMTASGGGSAGSAVWYGKGTNGAMVPDGTYSFAVGDAGGTGAQITGGQTTPWVQRRHAFPVRGSHGYGGAASRFGAPRAGHTHQGQDVAAACGTPLVAAQGGTVMTRAYQASGAGYYLVIRGRGTRQDYVYMHLQGPGAVAQGQTVKTGGRIGRVGTTGSSTGCHLHFELWTKPGWYNGGAPYDPLPALKYWDSYS